MDIMNSENEVATSPQVDEVAHVSGQRVPAVARAVSLLSALSSGPQEASLAWLARQTGIPRSSALAICSTLSDAGLMVRTASGRYSLGPRSLEFSHAYLAQLDLPRVFDQRCDELGVLPEQTLVLAVLSGTDVVYVGRRGGTRPLAVSYQLGLRLPAHCTATGKALLAELDPEELAGLYRDVTEPLQTLTTSSINSRESLAASLEQVRQRGFSVDDEETGVGMMCFGVPIFDNRHQAVGAVATSTVKAAVDDQLTETLVRELKRLATDLSRSLGSRMQT